MIAASKLLPLELISYASLLYIVYFQTCLSLWNLIIMQATYSLCLNYFLSANCVPTESRFQGTILTVDIVGRGWW